ncbi:SLC24A2 [Symbiodinium sp. CCMP2592]|nr:SLC24A2 [Symbiodinium sp. CCMP2592]
MPGLPAPQRLLPSAVPEREASHPEVARMQSRFDAAGAKFAKRTKHVSWDAKETEEKNFALFKWLKIIERGPWDFAVSRDFLRARLLGLGAGDLLESISNALAAKSTATLHTRAGPMIRYLAFCDLEGIEPFPIREEVMYKFFYDMQAQVAATFFKSVLASLAFGRFVLGLDSAVLALDSLRVKGLARKLYLGIRRLQQRPPLRVKDVIRLELICTGDVPRSALDVVMAGFILFMVFSRARHSDAQHVCSFAFELDFRGDLPAGFINAEVKKTKTSFTVERKTKFLPMLAPARGLSGKCWASGWKAALKKEGITAGEGKPLMPSPKSGGGWNVIPQTAQASGQWMRALLNDGTDDPYLLGLGTHSAKTTLLSWLNKKGVARDVTALLGYHATKDAGIGTEIIYARDAMAYPLRVLQELVDEVRDRSFRPDETRGLMTAAEREAAGVRDDAGADCSSSSSEDEECPRHDEGAEGRVLGPWAGRVDRSKIPGEAVMARNETSRVLHISREEQATAFICGRKITAAYEVLRAEDVDNPKLRAHVPCKSMMTCCGGGEALTKLKAAGINTLAKVAFVSSYAPGAPSDSELIKVLNEALGKESDAGQKASWRRLFHEAYAVATQELKTMAEWPDEAGPRRLSHPERAERYRMIKASVSGIDIKDRNEPSDALLDLCVGIYEGNRLRYVSWDRCTSKSQELSSEAKRDSMLTVDSQGRLKAEAKSDHIKADTRSRAKRARSAGARSTREATRSAGARSRAKPARGARSAREVRAREARAKPREAREAVRSRAKRREAGSREAALVKPREAGSRGMPAFALMLPPGKGLCRDFRLRRDCFRPQSPRGKHHPEVARMQSRFDAAGAKFAKRTKHVSWDAKETEEKNFALFKWLKIIERGPWDFAVSRDFLRARLLGLGAGDLLESISNALAAKSTATLHTRAGPMIRYLAFCDLEGIEPFPIREEVMYKFFYDMQAQVAATFFKSVLASLAFGRFVLGLDSAVLALDSLRVKGLARKLYLGIRRLQQRPPLRVKDVIRLELICTGDVPRSALDVVMAGFILFMVFSRARHSDAQHVCSLAFELHFRGDLPAGFINAEVKKTKASFTVERKTKFLPMLAPARGLSGKCWASGWKAALKKEGITAGEGKPLMPSPNSGGGWNVIPQTAQASGQWMRALLNDGTDDPYLLGLGTHSAKTTLLSWLNKKGVARDVTALLGYHATKDAGIGTEIIYARDAMAYPLRVLQELVDEVRDRSFRPDETRGLMTAAEREAAGVRDDAGADCSSSSSEDEECPRHDEGAEGRVLGPWAGRVDRSKIPGEAVMARNETSRVLHISREEQATAFICGRKITAAYEVLRAEDVDNPKLRAHVPCKSMMTCCGGGEALIKLKAAGINTLAKVAFVSSYAPGAASDSELIKVLNEALGKESDAGQKASWRRLFHEAYAVATQELKTMAERPDEAGPRRLSQPERAERYRMIKASVSGIDIKDRNEPSDALLDLCVGIYEGNRLRYVSWDRCTSKSQELSSEAKRDSMLTVDSQGRLKAEAKSDHIKADTSSEILLQFALLRRGLALEMSNLLDFRLHRRWAEKLIETRMAAQLDTHSQVSFAQLEAADQKFFQELADRTRDGVQATALGRPLDDCFDEVFNLPEVTRVMQPLPKPSGRVEPPPKPRWSPYDRPSKGGRKGKSPGTGKSTPRMPRELVGCKACTNRGDPICFGYGLKTCSEQVKGGRCPKGLHVCAVPKCGGAHPALDCPQYAALKKGPRIVLIGFVVKATAEIPDQDAEMQRAPAELLLRSNFAPGQDSSVLARLQSANRIFIQLGAFLLRARELGVAFSLMHPMSSWLWELPPFADLLKVSSEVPVYLMSDLHRLQHFRLVYTLCDLSSLAAADRTDAMTQKLFCDRFAAALSTQVAASGLGPSPLRLPEVRAAAQNQPKASKLPPLVPEFAYTQRLTCEGPPPLDAKKQLTHPWNGVPKHARLLRSSTSEGGATEESAQQATNISSQKPRHTEYVFGVYREPVQFVYQAVALQHPFDAARALPDKLVRVLFATLTKGPLCIMRNRLLLLQKWNQWAKDLRSDEASLQASLHPSVRKVLQGKKLLLLDKIARSLDWPDKHLHRDLCAGFKLSGVPDPTGVFEPDHKPALSSEEQFWDAAEVLKHQLWARVREQPAQEYDAELAEITLGETDVSGGKGWLEGPLSFSELQDRFKGQWMPCRRFAVWQNKWRPIDDLSESGLNATFGCHEKIPLRALDEVVWICTKIMQAASARGDVTLQLSSGESLKGKLHEHWADKEKIRPVTTAFDLKSAYKQLPLAPEEQSKAIVTIRHPSQTEPSGYICHTLPFGACGSVLHFNRVSALLRRIMLEMEILTALYYDDYPVVSPCLLGNSTAAAFTSVMSQAIAVAIEEIITRGHVAPRELPSLFGRLQFAEAQILGRMGRLAIHDLRSLERSSAARVNLTAQHLEALLLLKERVVSGAPRNVSASVATSPIVIFTDGCFEPDAANPAGVGGVMFAPSSGGGLKVRAFGSLVPKTLLEAWHARGKRHLIGQVEMFAVIIARSWWANVLDGARVIYFVDHSGVLAACISGSSKEDTWRKLLCAFEKADSLPAMQWFSRVPSHSNISDGPSRGRWEGLLRAFPECVIDDPCCPLTGTMLQRFV